MLDAHRITSYNVCYTKLLRGGNSHSAMMLGINVKRTVFLTYVICGLTAGIAGFVYIMTTGAGNVGNASGAEMKAIASAIIGGTLLNGGVGNLLGAPIGTLTLLVINELIRAAGIQSVITSYSIHYTKLYDRLKAEEQDEGGF